MRIRPQQLLNTLLIFSLLTTSCQKKEAAVTTDSSGYKGFTLLTSSKTHIKNNNTLPETPTQNHFIWDSYYNGGGVAAGDVNNDGLVDLYFTNTMTPNALYLNKGNLVFEDVTKKAGVRGEGVSWGPRCTISMAMDGLISMSANPAHLLIHPPSATNVISPEMAPGGQWALTILVILCKLPF
jgi:hypothetical protein